MLEHLKAQIGDKDTKDMTADELQFYYFNYGSKSSFFGDFRHNSIQYKDNMIMITIISLMGLS